MTVRAGRVRISSGYVPIAVLCICAAMFGDRFPASLLCVILHEAGHVLMLLRFGAEVVDIRLGFMSADIIDREKTVRPRREETLITLAGPAANLLCAPLFCAVFRVSGARFFADCAMMSIVLCVFNLLPISGTDGGVLFEALLAKACGITTAERVLTVCTAILLLPLSTAAFLILLRTRRNFTLLFAALCMIYSMTNTRKGTADRITLSRGAR